MRQTGRNRSSPGANRALRALSAAVALCLAVALGVAAPASAAGGGNSKNAKLCQHGAVAGSGSIRRVAVKSTGACVSYAAQGGTFTAPAQITE